MTIPTDRKYLVKRVGDSRFVAAIFAASAPAAIAAYIRALFRAGVSANPTHYKAEASRYDHIIRE